MPVPWFTGDSGTRHDVRRKRMNEELVPKVQVTVFGNRLLEDCTPSG